MKICIIGTSPIMLLKALKLSSYHDVKIFDFNRNIGGAWSVNKFSKHLYVPRQTNVIVPTSLKEEKKIFRLNKYLERDFKIKIEKFNNFKFKQNYKPKNIYFYDLSVFFNIVKNKLNIKKKKITKILVKGKSLYLGKEKFDKVFIPYFNSINNNCRKSIPEYKIYKSKHLVCIMKKKKKKKLIYQEYTDSVFDRYLINGKKNYFVGRISKEYKAKSFKEIMSKTSIKFLDSKNIKKKIFFYYKNYKREKKQIKKLVSSIKNKNLIVVNTMQITTSLTKMFKYL